MAQELHQGVDADVGELGGECVAQAVNQCAGAAFAVDSGMLKSRRTRYCSVPQMMRSPSAPRNRGAVGEKLLSASPAVDVRPCVRGQRALRVRR